MKNANIGVANLVISSKLKDSYFNKELLEESKKLTTDFFDVVKSSPILQLEFKVFNNLENKNIENELIATRYIDNNIKLFEVYTISEIERERGKLSKFLLENVVPTITNADYNLKRIELYNAIDNLITESLTDYDNINVDDVHDSFTVVLNHIKSPKKQLIESKELKPVNEHVIEIAINRFNEKYDTLNESDKSLLKKLIKSNDVEKQELFEEYKTEMLTILEGVDKSKYEEMARKAITKIMGMKYNSNTINDDIISLHEFKKEII
jgi:hypothetical protein